MMLLHLKVIGTNLLCCCLQPSNTDDAATDIATKLLMPLMLERSVVNQPPWMTTRLRVDALLLRGWCTLDRSSIPGLEDGKWSETATASDGVPPIHHEQASSLGWTRCYWEDSMILTKKGQNYRTCWCCIKKIERRNSSSSSVNCCIEREKKNVIVSQFFNKIRFAKLRTRRCIVSPVS